MPLTAEYLIEQLPIVDENILAEAAIQPQKFVHAARYRVDKMRRRAEARAALESRRSTLAIRLRKKYSDKGEKLTEASLKELVEIQSSVQRLRADLDRADEAEEFSKLLIDAYKQRRDAIRLIGESQNIEAIRGTKEVERIEQNRRIRKVVTKLTEDRERAHDND